jgi:hypothetical protein
MESYFYHTRAERRELGLNGFDLESYNTLLMQTHFLQHKNRKSFTLRLYDHNKGFLPNTLRVNPEHIPVFEGFAFFSLLEQYHDYCIANYFIFPSRIKEWLVIHTQRDQNERDIATKENLFMIEANQKAKSLANSMIGFQTKLQATKYVCLNYGATKQLNEYSFATDGEGGKFIHEIKFL